MRKMIELKFFEKPCNLCIGKALPKKTPFILSMAKNGGEGGLPKLCLTLF